MRVSLHVLSRWGKRCGQQSGVSQLKPHRGRDATNRNRTEDLRTLITRLLFFIHGFSSTSCLKSVSNRTWKGPMGLVGRSNWLSGWRITLTFLCNTTTPCCLLARSRHYPSKCPASFLPSFPGSIPIMQIAIMLSNTKNVQMISRTSRSAVHPSSCTHRKLYSP